MVKLQKLKSFISEQQNSVGQKEHFRVDIQYEVLNKSSSAVCYKVTSTIMVNIAHNFGKVVMVTSQVTSIQWLRLLNSPRDYRDTGPPGVWVCTCNILYTDRYRRRPQISKTVRYLRTWASRYSIYSLLYFRADRGVISARRKNNNVHLNRKISQK